MKVHSITLRAMPDLNDYRCPRVCPGRSKYCHSTCERHATFRELNAERLKAVHNEHMTLTEAVRVKLNKNVRKRVIRVEKE